MVEYMDKVIGKISKELSKQDEIDLDDDNDGILDTLETKFH